MLQTPVNIIKGDYVANTAIHNIYGRTWHASKKYKNQQMLQVI